jgi:dolichol-phosphate mannosyltransferase
MSVLVVIPTYNEKENISRIIREVLAYAPRAEILIVDDSSPDGTAEIVKGIQKEIPQVHLLLRKNKEGLGKAYVDAFMHVFKTYSPDRIVMMDADMSHNPKYLPEMERKMDQGFSVVIGSRYISGGGTVGWSLWRKTLSYFGNLYARTIIGIPLHDLTAGFYMVQTSLLRSVNLDQIHSSGYAFQMELKNLLIESGGVCAEIPIIFGDRSLGESKISNNIIAEGVIAPWKIRMKTK